MILHHAATVLLQILFSVFRDPRYCKVHQCPLFHTAHRGIADLRHFHRVGLLKSPADLLPGQTVTVDAVDGELVMR